ncbi:hypothetical protein K437DRAFT_258145 [Tilletiaria anomala UBC 951]|uniref:Uncharacterized protein n=1 Tax=Tilletiaria anomala (strain ATCC 24038 / CBS 436.72 / UBC 951) TaxID=1037660 RepID=A0A066VNE8_TILAU|nr:uncharacterized protein K437DRAFT_258145 [Tilletiaria anomala UBC 951]KDN41798.1 hypothetical protein K437DRAFT_258145 [Tilletiaria anomala UBC 951]
MSCSKARGDIALVGEHNNNTNSSVIDKAVKKPECRKMPIVPTGAVAAAVDRIGSSGLDRLPGALAQSVKQVGASSSPATVAKTIGKAAPNLLVSNRLAVEASAHNAEPSHRATAPRSWRREARAPESKLQMESTGAGCGWSCVHLYPFTWRLAIGTCVA